MVIKMSQLMLLLLRKFQLIKVDTSALFVSDTHLSEDSPETINKFNDFLMNHANKHNFLFILGDLFEYWIGDDSNQFNTVINTLKKLKTKIFFIPGNRDFLIGNDFLIKTNIEPLKDPTLIQLGNKKAIVLHGDTLCTDDKDYQSYRRKVRSNQWQKEFLDQSIKDRLEICKDLREQSKKAQENKSETLMDVNENEVKKLFKKFNYPPIMIHGHTHRPKKHKYKLKDSICERWVLNDWYDSSSFLFWENNRLSEKIL
ncbi:MAG: UDP-2,3-diacylglucosamine diphosphatase [Nitrosomonadales bacterium]|nr:UDP-2,3-diacylglucosamine diphosphatase [Nitrosomonadales bacterium]